jgi:hypothetical protein
MRYVLAISGSKVGMATAGAVEQQQTTVTLRVMMTT